MLNQHQYECEDYCRHCGELAPHPIHCIDPAQLLAKTIGWDHWMTVFFVLTFVSGTATGYNICTGRWDRATFFLVVTLELLRLWGKHEVARRE